MRRFISFFIITTTAVLFAPSLTRNQEISSLTDAAINVDCSQKLNGFYSKGPCDEEFYLCTDGRLRLLTCPKSLLFNPSSSFCEKISDLFPFNAVIIESGISTSQSPAQITPSPLNMPSPMTSKVESLIPSVPLATTLFHAGETETISVKQNDNGINFVPERYSPYVLPYGSMPSQLTSKARPNVNEIQSIDLGHSTFSVFIPSNSQTAKRQREDTSLTHIHPYTGALRQPSNSAPEIYYPIYRPYVSKIDSISSSVESSEYTFPHADKPPHVESDYFLFPSAPVLIPKRKSKDLIDDFNRLNGHEKQEPLSSSFASMLNPIKADHDTFNSKIEKKKVNSGFAPMHSAIDGGHDAFKGARNRRSTDICGQKLSAARNLSLLNDVATEKSDCITNEHAHGCRSLYVACIEGRRVKRHCGKGMFFNSEKEACEDRSLVKSCQFLSKKINKTPNKRTVQSFLVKCQNLIQFL